MFVNGMVAGKVWICVRCCFFHFHIKPFGVLNVHGVLILLHSILATTYSASVDHACDSQNVCRNNVLSYPALIATFRKIDHMPIHS